MTLLAGNDPANGLFVKAESHDAAGSIMSFIGVPTSTATFGPLYLSVVLLMWALSQAALIRFA